MSSFLPLLRGSQRICRRIVTPALSFTVIPKKPFTSISISISTISPNKIHSVQLFKHQQCSLVLINHFSTSSTLRKQSTIEPSTKIQQSTTKDSKHQDDTDLAVASTNTPEELVFTPIASHTPKRLVNLYKDLTKIKLSSLVVLTTMAGFAIAPTHLLAAFPLSTHLSLLFSTTIGTALCVASANTFNQFVEWPFDSQMTRTRNRPLARHALSPVHAFSVGLGTGITGVAMLAYFVNPVVAVLGLGNIILYAGVYTPLKRVSIANTWVGSLVGAIPPLMGWAAVTGTILDLPQDIGGWLLAYLLFAWQFPHFNALSWNLREDYTRGGYRMMSVLNPRLCIMTSLRYSIFLFPLCSWAIPAAGMTTWTFAATSLIPNSIMAFGAYRFWQSPSPASARQLFFASLVYLPIILALLMVHKACTTNTEENMEKAITMARKEEEITKGEVVCVYERVEKWLVDLFAWLGVKKS